MPQNGIVQALYVNPAWAWACFFAKLNSAQLKLQLQLELSIALISFFSHPPTPHPPTRNSSAMTLKDLGELQYYLYAHLDEHLS